MLAKGKGKGGGKSSKKGKDGQPGTPRSVNSGKCTQWYKTGTCSYGENCRFTHDENDKAKGKGTKSPVASPRDTSKYPCKFFKEGNCTKGDQCKWSHDQAICGMICRVVPRSIIAAIAQESPRSAAHSLSETSPINGYVTRLGEYVKSHF